MDQQQCTTLMEMLQRVADPRKARGKRYKWPYLLLLIAMAVTQGQRSVHAIAEWIRLHTKGLKKALNDEGLRIPSESTIWRTLHSIDVDDLEEQIAQWGQRQAQKAGQGSEKPSLSGLALDGKEVRGVRAHGKPVCLVSVVTHGDGIVLAQAAVAKGGNEISTWPWVLGQCRLAGRVTTVDAMFTQQELARYIRRRKGHYLMVVKGNQPVCRKRLRSCSTVLPGHIRSVIRNTGHANLSKKDMVVSIVVSQSAPRR
jgi:urease gamma subunit